MFGDENYQKIVRQVHPVLIEKAKSRENHKLWRFSAWI